MVLFTKYSESIIHRDEYQILLYYVSRTNFQYIATTVIESTPVDIYQNRQQIRYQIFWFLREYKYDKNNQYVVFILTHRMMPARFLFTYLWYIYIEV